MEGLRATTSELRHLQYWNTHSSAKRAFQSSASSFGMAVNPCLHIRPVLLRALFKRAIAYSSANPHLLQHTGLLQGRSWCICRGGICRGACSAQRAMSAASWPEALLIGCTTTLLAKQVWLLQCEALLLPDAGAQCRETASSAPPSSVCTERGPRGTILASRFSILLCQLCWRLPLIHNLKDVEDYNFEVELPTGV